MAENIPQPFRDAFPDWRSCDAMDREPCRGAPVYDGGKRCSSHSEDLARQQQLSRRLARDLDLDPGEIAELKALMSRTEADDLAWRESEKRRRQRDGAAE